jgi:hypothetical protein
MIKVFVLESGIQMIAECNNDDSGYPIAVKEPCIMQMVPDNKKRGAELKMLPMLMFSNNDDAKLNISNVLLVYEPNQEVEDRYRQLVKQIAAQRAGVILN